jgi:hypothetical protein
MTSEEVVYEGPVYVSRYTKRSFSISLGRLKRGDLVKLDVLSLSSSYDMKVTISSDEDILLSFECEGREKDKGTLFAYKVPEEIDRCKLTLDGSIEGNIRITIIRTEESKTLVL